MIKFKDTLYPFIPHFIMLTFLLFALIFSDSCKYVVAHYKIILDLGVLIFCILIGVREVKKNSNWSWKKSLKRRVIILVAAFVVNLIINNIFKINQPYFFIGLMAIGWAHAANIRKPLWFMVILGYSVITIRIIEMLH